MQTEICGIYKITNTNNNKIYIGSSKNIDKRFQEHLYSLKNNLHHSSKLQRSYNKTNDKSIFKFEIIEEMTEDKLKEKEQYYIDLYDSFNTGYNCCAKVDNPKYSLKNSKKAINKQNLDNLYNEFINLYKQNKNNLKIGGIFLNRLLNKYYKHHVYKNINSIIKWFLDNYDLKDYIAKINAYQNKQYYLTIIDNENKELFCYKWHKNQMYDSK